ncbi:MULTISPECIES: DUF1489 family protein [Sphingomonas]|uniref:DUF1489 domain-containing protein n=1 Tax=Sphingomonas lycopersici TaxID=2951807 RepID=A0AA41Z8T0_9SPHN|nr:MULTISPECIES: DUF1489 domain-containing protein [Sphingomonas]MCW6531620.1 DUF1489 domain-containing protein [Sphingomonas lycopersici]MCW6535019.1 DUF1489 domain-containing protein [Sphingomonas lycopersici]OJU16910.1 MAG: hypothetical protein BGN95_06550 [Sphingomonas sp. 66-10]
MPLHLTKVAFGAAGVEDLAERLRIRGEQGPVFLTTRYLPKRHEEIAGQGSLFWIIKHALVARSPILSFGEAEGGRVAIHIDPLLRLVHPRPKRAHQGWRYLEAADAPIDLAGGEAEAVLPASLAGRLAELGLL